MFEAVEGLVTERHELEQQLADPATHADQGLAKRLNQRYAEVSAIAERLDDPREILSGTARALRALASRSPNVTTLLFCAPAPLAGPSPEAVAPLMTELLGTVREIAPDDPLSAARTLTAWAYGFCTMEQNGGFRQGGDVDAAFERGLEIVLRGIGD